MQHKIISHDQNEYIIQNTMAQLSGGLIDNNATNQCEQFYQRVSMYGVRALSPEFR